MKTVASLALIVPLLLTTAAPAVAHHGVASPGVAGLEGPGAPLETTSTATLPVGGWLFYAKLDHASFDTFTPARDDEGDVSDFWMFGLGWGATPWLSLYAFAPYQVKTAEDNGFNTAGFADPSVLAVAGFVWDGGPRPVPATESLDDLEDWHLSLWAGSTLPLGDPDVADADGVLDPGLALGFGEPALQVGLSVSKMLGSRWTLVGEASHIAFAEHVYEDGSSMRFGGEWRVNAAVCLRAWTAPDAATRLDLNLEGGALRLGRDRADGVDEAGTGGDILYLLPGLRLTREHVSVGVGLKTPVWTDLNEDASQQGAEGKESSRLIVTVSTLF